MIRKINTKSVWQKKIELWSASLSNLPVMPNPVHVRYSICHARFQKYFYPKLRKRNEFYQNARNGRKFNFKCTCLKPYFIGHPVWDINNDQCVWHIIYLPNKMAECKLFEKLILQNNEPIECVQSEHGENEGRCSVKHHLKKIVPLNNYFIFTNKTHNSFGDEGEMNFTKQNR